MNVSRETYRHSPHELHMPQPYTPTPDGFERRLRAWVRLPMDDVPIPGAGGANASPQEPDTRDLAGGTTHTRKGHRRQRGGGPDA